MSHASNKVKWCLNKAKKEFAEKGFHRGLVKGESNREQAEKHILKAEHNLNAALSFEKGGFSDWSASAFFYCIYHCFLAILQKNGYESRNQECTTAIIELLKEEGTINIDNKFINAIKITKNNHTLIQLREHYQYGVELEFKKKKELQTLTQMCKEIIEETKNIVYS